MIPRSCISCPACSPTLYDACTREQYRAQLANIHASRQAKMASVATPRVSLSSSLKASGPLTDPNGVPTGQASISGAARGAAGALRGSAAFKSLSETITEGSEPRKLARFEQAEREWVANVAALAAQTGRPAFEVQMRGAGHEWRQKKEALQALERAMPIRDRLGGEDAFNMSLRDMWERNVAVGGPTSGLAAIVREKQGGK